MRHQCCFCCSLQSGEKQPATTSPDDNTEQQQQTPAATTGDGDGEAAPPAPLGTPPVPEQCHCCQQKEHHLCREGHKAKKHWGKRGKRLRRKGPHGIRDFHGGQRGCHGSENHPMRDEHYGWRSHVMRRNGHGHHWFGHGHGHGHGPGPYGHGPGPYGHGPGPYGHGPGPYGHGPHGHGHHGSPHFGFRAHGCYFQC